MSRHESFVDLVDEGGMIEARMCQFMIQGGLPVGYMPIQINLRHSSPLLSPLLQELGNRAKRLISINVRIAT